MGRAGGGCGAHVSLRMQEDPLPKISSTSTERCAPGHIRQGVRAAMDGTRSTWAPLAKS